MDYVCVSQEEKERKVESYNIKVIEKTVRVLTIASRRVCTYVLEYVHEVENVTATYNYARRMRIKILES